MKKVILFIFISSFAFSQKTISILPKPQSLIQGKGEFVINGKTQISVPKDSPDILEIAEQLTLRLKLILDFNTEVTTNKVTNGIVFVKNSELTKEAYKLTVKPSGITLEYSNAIGCFYGLQSLLQLMPTEIYSSSPQSNIKLVVPECSIVDNPRFEYRGFMLDVGRHYFPVGFIKKLIDLLAMHKLNVLHWHLTEDQGWRIEIKKYPKLTEIGSRRRESPLGHNRDNKGDGEPYEGFYTQAQVKEIVAYAKKKYVTVIPEIEMPGHSLAAIAAYPELGCTNDKYEVGIRWGVENRVFCPTETTFAFIEDVLTEVFELFPSQYIHIGGDECPKDAWKKSEFCQNLIKKEGLKDEHELQSWFIKRIDKFVTSKGKKLIGWDEILEGGISPNATIMSWRGTEGGIAAAKQKHDVIMTPNQFAYLDYYQIDASSEPLAIGGNLSLEKVYSYEPIDKSLTSEEAKYIKGIQGNLWTEYVKTPEYAEYMAFPRLLAIAEIGWSNKTKSYSDFTNRLVPHFKRLDQLAVNYSKAFYSVKLSTTKDKKDQIYVLLETNSPKNTIRYTLDGSQPNAKSLLYSSLTKIKLTNDVSISAASFSADGKMLGMPASKMFIYNKATGKPYSLSNEPKKYTGGEIFALTNGVIGDVNNNENWVGLENKNLETVIDLQQKTTFSRVGMSFKNAYNSFIVYPRSVEIFISNDKIKFNSIKKIDLNSEIKNDNSIQNLNISTETQNARYLKIVVEKYGLLPKSHPNEGMPSWIFMDEIIIK